MDLIGLVDLDEDLTRSRDHIKTISFKDKIQY